MTPAALHTDGVNEVNVIGFVDGAALKLVLAAVTKTSG